VGNLRKLLSPVSKIEISLQISHSKFVPPDKLRDKHILFCEYALANFEDLTD
jgi:hypothetical protein